MHHEINQFIDTNASFIDKHQETNGFSTYLISVWLNCDDLMITLSGLKIYTFYEVKSRIIDDHQQLHEKLSSLKKKYFF